MLKLSCHEVAEQDGEEKVQMHLSSIEKAD
jgi:hypothetical protein